jgi:hypothetical protein
VRPSGAFVLSKRSTSTRLERGHGALAVELREDLQRRESASTEGGGNA